MPGGTVFVPTPLEDPGTDSEYGRDGSSVEGEMSPPTTPSLFASEGGVGVSSYPGVRHVSVPVDQRVIHWTHEWGSSKNPCIGRARGSARVVVSQSESRNAESYHSRRGSTFLSSSDKTRSIRVSRMRCGNK